MGEVPHGRHTVSSGREKGNENRTHPSKSLATHEQVDDDDLACEFLSLPSWHDLQLHCPGVHCAMSEVGGAGREERGQLIGSRDVRNRSRERREGLAVRYLPPLPLRVLESTPRRLRRLARPRDDIFFFVRRRRRRRGMDRVGLARGPSGALTLQLPTDEHEQVVMAG